MVSAFILSCPTSCAPLSLGKSKSFLSGREPSSSSLYSPAKRSGVGVKACFPNPSQEPILREALKEPVAFMGGILAGVLRLDLKDEPLKEWVTRTVEASGMTLDEIDAADAKLDEIPQQIEIE